MKDVFCPYCSTHLLISPNLEKSSYLKCTGCNKDFQNPLITKPNTTSIKWSHILIGLGILLIAYYGFIDKGNKNKVYNSEYDGSVHQVEKYLKESYLKDPDSYQSIKWSKVMDMVHSDYGYRYKVMHKYRAKNSFGGYSIESKIFYLDDDGDIVDVSTDDSGNSLLESSKSTPNNSLEFDDEVRKMAYIAGKDKILEALIKDGSSNIAFYPYNPNKSRYLGSNRFLVNIYYTYIYDGYNRKKGVQLEMFYYGNNTWKTNLLKQRNID